MDGKRRPLVVAQHDGAGSAWKQLHMVLGGVDQVGQHGAGLLDGVHAHVQVGDLDAAPAVGGPVQVVRAVFDAGDAEGDPG
ncbi:hypothetical protein SDC9_174487 [bioreactor metagenome]|uniref:Uncharacterized protein n=1 Tax=bioreactor metagenome TaxID=1076179 RepID=A0A645GLL8_9ZZZZ